MIGSCDFPTANKIHVRMRRNLEIYIASLNGLLTPGSCGHLVGNFVGSLRSIKTNRF